MYNGYEYIILIFIDLKIVSKLTNKVKRIDIYGFYFIFLPVYL